MSQLLLDPKVWAAIIGLITILFSIWKHYLSHDANLKRLQKKIRAEEEKRDEEGDARIQAENIASNEAIDRQDAIVDEWMNQDTRIVDPLEIIDSQKIEKETLSNGSLVHQNQMRAGGRVQNPLTTPIWNAVLVAADHHKIKRELLAAVVMVESAGDPYAMRFEPLWKHIFKAEEFARRCNSSRETEEISQSTSWGLCQVMGTVAREYGHLGYLSELCKPALSLQYGCLHLKKKIEKFGELPGIAAYNAGTPKKLDNGAFQNQAYVDKILKWQGEFSLLVDDKLT